MRSAGPQAGSPAAPQRVSQAESLSDRLRILFIGNSYTARYDLPGLIAQLARPRSIETEMIVAGGASLRRHWNGGRAAAEIARGAWDYVVLQEQSTLPVKNRVRYHENVRLFDAAIKSIGARTVLYLTWARANASSTQDAIDSAVYDIAQETGAVVVPVGVVWRRVTRTHPEIALYLPDGSHPTAAGAYLSACVFVSTMFEANAAELPLPATLELDDDIAAVLRHAVAQRD